MQIDLPIKKKGRRYKRYIQIHKQKQLTSPTKKEKAKAYNQQYTKHNIEY